MIVSDPARIRPGLNEALLATVYSTYRAPCGAPHLSRRLCLGMADRYFRQQRARGPFYLRGEEPEGHECSKQGELIHDSHPFRWARRIAPYPCTFPTQSFLLWMLGAIGDSPESCCGNL